MTCDTCLPSIEEICLPPCNQPPTVEELECALRAAAEFVGDLLAGAGGAPAWDCEGWVYRPCTDSCTCDCVCPNSCDPLGVTVVPLVWELGPLVAVWVDGVRHTVDEPGYMFRVLRHLDRLVVTPVDTGAGLFTPPTANGPNLYHTLPGTWGFEFGGWIPQMVRRLIIGVASELIKPVCGAPCELAAGAVSISEDGVTVSVDRTKFFAASQIPIVGELSNLIALYGGRGGPRFAGGWGLPAGGWWDRP